MNPDTVGRDSLVQQLLELGVEPGGVLLVHTAFSRVGRVEGGPWGLIAALRDALGADGTLVMPSMSSDKENAFDPKRTPCRGMGIVAETFWRSPGVLRSDSPHAFAAVGPEAAWITAPHPIDVPHGLDSPAGRAYELGAQVLLLGVDHSANTTVHLAENLAGVRYRRAKQVRILQRGKLVPYRYGEIDHCCENFGLVDGWLDGEQLQRRGGVGQGDARLTRSRDLVRVVVDRLRQNETVFLHPFGVDRQCDEARRSLEAGPDAAWG